MLFALLAGGAFHTAVEADAEAPAAGLGPRLVAEADVPWTGDGRKLLMDDPGRGYTCSLERFAAGATRPASDLQGACALLVLSGRAVAGGETLGPWDLVYGPPPALEFPDPCTLAVTTATSRIAATR
jgi:hypothetical protein